MIEAIRALHQRMSLACAAASAAGVPGRFHAWEQDGAFAVLATDPALAFLSTVTGAARPAAALARAPIWESAKPTLVTDDKNPLSDKGFVRVGPRLVAVKELPEPTEPDSAVVETDDRFTDVLLTGYEVTGTVAAFIRAEHRDPAVQRFLAMAGTTPIGAAAMTVHGDVAVLGGASTLRAQRGKGAQSRLLRHRLHVAGAAGCVLAVATAAPDSVSAANLRAAGFTLHRRSAWVATT